MEQEYEIKFTDADGKSGVATWPGKDGPAACARYADAHKGVTVTAYRTPRTYVGPVNTRTLRIVNDGCGS